MDRVSPYGPTKFDRHWEPEERGAMGKIEGRREIRPTSHNGYIQSKLPPAPALSPLLLSYLSFAKFMIGEKRLIRGQIGSRGPVI